MFYDIKQETEVKEKQKILESYLLLKQDRLSEIKLYCMRKEHLKILNDSILSKIDNKITKTNEYQYSIILFLEKKENVIYYILETLVKVIRFYKQEYNKNLKLKYEKGYTNKFSEELNTEFSYTESYFKSIIRQLYIVNILSDANVIERYELYKNKDIEFLVFLEKLQKFDNEFYIEIITLYESFDNFIDIINKKKI
jgi:hypothetical protein